MLVSVTSEVGCIEIHVARITRPSIRHKKEYNLNLTLPFNPYPYPLSLTPGIVMARYFDCECERRLLVRVTGRRLIAVLRLPHIMQK